MLLLEWKKLRYALGGAYIGVAPILETIRYIDSFTGRSQGFCFLHWKRELTRDCPTDDASYLLPLGLVSTQAPLISCSTCSSSCRSSRNLWQSLWLCEEWQEGRMYERKLILEQTPPPHFCHKVVYKKCTYFRELTKHSSWLSHCHEPNNYKKIMRYMPNLVSARILPYPLLHAVACLCLRRRMFDIVAFLSCNSVSLEGT